MVATVIEALDIVDERRRSSFRISVGSLSIMTCMYP